jgi:Spy/CpxP family protein refolding chaperone
MNKAGGLRLKIWLVLVAVFAFGCVTGAALDGLYRSRAGGRDGERCGEEERARKAEAHFERMRGELGLSEEQAAKVRAVLDETRDEYRRLHAEVRPRFEEPRLKARARIRALLAPEQQQKFDALAAERDARREREAQKRDGQ